MNQAMSCSTSSWDKRQQERKGGERYLVQNIVGLRLNFLRLCLLFLCSFCDFWRNNWSTRFIGFEYFRNSF
ncbi:hypothetical protein Mapa_008842 [Marchantia paleacea]|nr:hypothetical protein Mapa_008842 [Marchantia paleacea]